MQGITLVAGLVIAMAGCTQEQGGNALERGQSVPDVRLGSVTLEASTIEVEGSTIAIADINGDGNTDLLSAGRRLTVLLGDGDGGLERAGSIDAGEQPDDLALADIDRDGDTDVVVANHDMHYVTVLLGDGKGGFAPAAHSPIAVGVDPHPHAAALVDIDGDGLADLLVDHSPRGARDPELRHEDGGVLIRRGSGDARFETPGSIFESGGTPYRGFALGDLNGDGRPDIVTPLDAQLGVMLNTSTTGQASFDRAKPVRATSPFAVRLGDFNGDGHTDAISAAGENSTVVEVFLGDGAGGFARPESVRVGSGGKAIVVGDFDGDGMDDAALAAWRSSEVFVVRWGADGPNTTALPAGCDHPWGLAAGDLNGDGADELAIVGEGERQARVYWTSRK